MCIRRLQQSRAMLIEGHVEARCEKTSHLGRSTCMCRINRSLSIQLYSRRKHTNCSHGQFSIGQTSYSYKHTAKPWTASTKADKLRDTDAPQTTATSYEAESINPHHRPHRRPRHPFPHPHRLRHRKRSASSASWEVSRTMKTQEVAAWTRWS